MAREAGLPVATSSKQQAEPQHRSDIEGIPETAATATALNGVTTITIRMCRRCWNVITAKIFTGLRNVLLNFCNGKHYPVSHGHRREVVMIFIKEFFNKSS